MGLVMDIDNEQNDHSVIYTNSVTWRLSVLQNTPRRPVYYGSKENIRVAKDISLCPRLAIIGKWC